MTVTAVIPTVGRPELRRAVKSVLAQSRPVTPLVILDRPDRKREVSHLLAGLDYRLSMTSGGQGGSFARNLGVRQSDTKVVAFLDDDDEWLPGKTEVQLQLLAEAPDAVVASRAELVGSKTRALPENLFVDEQSLSTYLLERSTLRLRRNFIQSSTLLMDRGIALAHPWPERLERHQDWGLLIAMHRAGVAIRTAPETLVRVFQGSAGSISRSGAWRASLAWLEEYGRDAEPRSQADFMCSIALRGALQSREWSQALSIGSAACRKRPHVAALAVGLSGILRRQL